MKTRTSSLLLAALLVVPTVSSAQESGTPAVSETVGPADIQPGDTWTYKAENEITGETTSTNTYTVTEKSGETITVLATFDGGPGHQSSSPQQLTGNWGFIKTLDWSFSKPDFSNLPKTPFKIGTRWATNLTATHSNSRGSFRVKGVSSVVGREKITLPSGDIYDAYKIVADTTATATNGAKTLTHVDLWYDPVVNRYVERTVEIRNGGMLTSKVREYLVNYNRNVPS